jgi:hypothetical protein
MKKDDVIINLAMSVEQCLMQSKQKFLKDITSKDEFVFAKFVLEN